MYRVNVYIPSSHLEIVKTAMFDAGAGRIGNYDQCCWQVKGEGQFRPLVGSDAFIGQQDKIEKAAEYKVEMVCAASHMKSVLNAMLAAHPFEEVAYDVYLVLSLKDF